MTQNEAIVKIKAVVYTVASVLGINTTIKILKSLISSLESEHYKSEPMDW